MQLPKWVVDNRSSLRDEAEPYVGLSPEQRAPMVRAACRAAMRLLRARPDSALVLAHVDAVPESTERALARLRMQKKSTAQCP